MGLAANRHSENDPNTEPISWRDKPNSSLSSGAKNPQLPYAGAMPSP